MTGRPERLPSTLRMLRGGLLATCAAALTVTAHGVGGGDFPDGAMTVFATAIIALAATALADRKHSPATVVLALGVAQLFMHLLLNTGGSHHGSSTASDSARMALAHVVAGVLLGALLAKADACLLAFITAVRRSLPRIFPPPAIPRSIPSRPAVTDFVDMLHGVVVLTDASRRGPPLSR
ncbi:hypothetical protein SK854_13650 [Lentzea sp. BCCO 10_0061]|uniref:Uncharacterized protein n=1 Tax=Lentzea sokolovensis TaxID=3095429 RepID=A0ABU4UUI2_9PSEU|nr:hypothetical protein [Lentzea sp. BCCO 10_0061]MDX8143167.1 hypothetical protein [Lentzea sp. BCCO 10_0061]